MQIIGNRQVFQFPLRRCICVQHLTSETSLPSVFKTAPIMSARHTCSLTALQGNKGRVMMTFSWWDLGVVTQIVLSWFSHMPHYISAFILSHSLYHSLYDLPIYHWFKIFLSGFTTLRHIHIISFWDLISDNSQAKGASLVPRFHRARTAQVLLRKWAFQSLVIMTRTTFVSQKMNYEVAALRSSIVLEIGLCHCEYDVQYLSFIMICTFIHLQM